MQNKMITLILKGKVKREENILLKIKTEKALNKCSKRSKSKPKNCKNEIFEEYKFIATDNTLPIDKEESNFNNILNRNYNNNFPETDLLIKVTENAFIDDSKNFKNYDEQNIDTRLSQQNEYYFKSNKEGKC
jgi:hypothetical protein